MLVIDLPREIIEEILVRCDPWDVAQAAQTCWGLYSIICCADDSTLWRGLYLAQPLDDPRLTVSHYGRPRTRPIDWKRELQRIIRAGIVVNSSNPIDFLRPGELRAVLETLLDVVCNAAPKRTEESDEVSANLLWVAAMFSQGVPRTYSRCDYVSRRASVRRTIAHLLWRPRMQMHGHRASCNPARMCTACAIIVPLPSYGPFTEKGLVNWIHMQALHHIMSMHLISLKEGRRL